LKVNRKPVDFVTGRGCPLQVARSSQNAITPRLFLAIGGLKLVTGHNQL